MKRALHHIKTFETIEYRKTPEEKARIKSRKRRKPTLKERLYSRYYKKNF